ncbi:hypothetical protein MMC09_003645 [Bachmanniomyces sp. S44760]|nr:hypothetical protein [Bachmanniomyces sp. S44760]
MSHMHHRRTSSLQTPPRTPAGATTPLQASLSSAHARYTVRNQKSLYAHNEACRYMPGGNTRTVLHSSPFPLTFASGESCTLTSLDGDTFVDFLGEYTAGIYGHNNPKIQTAISNALGKGWNFGGNNVYEKELAKTVCDRFSPTMEQVRFTNSGTEANMMAIATAIAFTGRRKILVFTSAYHGSTISSPWNQEGPSINLPHEWIPAPYNDFKKTRAILFSLPPDSLAAILVEPMLGSGGAIPGKKEFLTYLRSAASEYGALLIFDEVMTSRLSYRGLGHKLGIRPDLMTLGKWVGGGMSFGAFGGSKDIMAMYDPRNTGGYVHHPGTFNNNVVSMSAGCAGCALLKPQVLDDLNARGDVLRNKIRDVLRAHGVCHTTTTNSTTPSTTAQEAKQAQSRQVDEKEEEEKDEESDSESHKSNMWVSGLGSILCIRFSITQHGDTLQGLLFHHMLEENIYMAPRGFVALSIEITAAHVDRFVTALERFVVRYALLILDGGLGGR